jgi:titin
VDKEGFSLSWEPPADDGGLPITEYRVWAREVGGAANEEGQLVTETTFELDGLKVGQEYTCQVAAVNEMGEGLACKELTVHTTAATVPGMPLGLQASDVSTDKMTVSWDPPVDDGGAPVTQYRLQWKKDGEDWQGKGQLVEAGEAGGRQFELGDLQANTAYNVKVAAMNEAGEGPSSEALSQKTEGRVISQC